MTDPLYRLFVYGSLRSGFRSEAYEYISRFFVFTGEAKVRGKLFDMGKYPAAVPTAEDAYITGELYTIRKEEEFAWAMGQLDDYEGITAEPGEPQLYRRGITEVFINEEVVTSWIYWYNGDVSSSPLILSGDLIQYNRGKI